MVGRCSEPFGSVDDCPNLASFVIVRLFARFGPRYSAIGHFGWFLITVSLRWLAVREAGTG